MKIYNIYFSPTGGTKKVTDMLGSAWREKNRRLTCRFSGKIIQGMSLKRKISAL